MKTPDPERAEAIRLRSATAIAAYQAVEHDEGSEERYAAWVEFVAAQEQLEALHAQYVACGALEPLEDG